MWALLGPLHWHPDVFKLSLHLSPGYNPFLLRARTISLMFTAHSCWTRHRAWNGIDAWWWTNEWINEWMPCQITAAISISESLKLSLSVASQSQIFKYLSFVFSFYCCHYFSVVLSPQLDNKLWKKRAVSAVLMTPASAAKHLSRTHCVPGTNLCFYFFSPLVILNDRKRPYDLLLSQFNWTVGLKLQCVAESSGGSVKTQISGPYPPRVSDAEFVFLTSSQVVLIPLLPSQTFENPCPGKLLLSLCVVEETEAQRSRVTSGRSHSS